MARTLASSFIETDMSRPGEALPGGLDTHMSRGSHSDENSIRRNHSPKAKDRNRREDSREFHIPKGTRISAPKPQEQVDRERKNIIFYNILMST